MAEVGVPDDATPIEFQTLDVKFRSDVFQVVGGPHIILAVEKPMYGINGRTDVDSVGLQALCLGGDNDPITRDWGKTLEELLKKQGTPAA